MSAKPKSLKKNFIMNALLTMSAFVFPLITFPYVSRVLGPAGLGRVDFATSVLTYFSMVAQLGIPTYGIRLCAKVRDDREKLTKTVHEILLLNTVTALIAYAVFAVLLFTVPRFSQDKTLFLIVSSTILFNVIGVEWLYRALEQYTYITVRSLIFKVIAIVGMFLLVRAESDYAIYGGITIFATCASNVFNFINLHRFVGLRPVGKYDLLRHIKPVLVFFAMSCAATIYTHLDTVMLGFMRTDAEVGCYNAAVKIKVMLVSLVTSLGTVLLPRASYYAEKGNTDELLRITQKAMGFVCVFACPLTVYFTVFAKAGIFLFSGEASAASVLPMQVIMPTLLFIGMTNILGMQILVPLGRERSVLLSTVIGAVVNLMLNLALIPAFGAVGAAIGTLVAEAAVWVAQCVLLRELIGRVYRRVRVWIVLLALVVGTIFSGWVWLLPLSEFFILALSAVLFFLGYGCTLLLFKEPLTKELLAQVRTRLHR